MTFFVLPKEIGCNRNQSLFRMETIRGMIMAEYQIFTDATCDMNVDILDDHHIEVLPMEVTMDDGNSFLHFPDFRNYAADIFYKKLAEGVLAHTSQITPPKFIEAFHPYLEKGIDILYVAFSSGLSNTYQSALLARNELCEEFPERKIIVIDSLAASTGEGIFALRAADNQAAGMTIEENAQWLEAHKMEPMHYFTVGDLFFLHKGGRVSAGTAIVGSALNIKPVMYVDAAGKLIVKTKAHGRKASLRKLYDLTRQTLVNGEEQTIFVAHTDCLPEAENVAALIRQNIPCKDVVITRVGPVVGTHTGPSLMCIFSWGNGDRS